jgi:hypothetical protein
MQRVSARCLARQNFRAIHNRRVRRASRFNDCVIFFLRDKIHNAAKLKSKKSRGAVVAVFFIPRLNKIAARNASARRSQSSRIGHHFERWPRRVE